VLLLLLVPASERLRRIPVPEHLHGQNDVQGEAAEESVEDDGIVDLGEGREDAGEGAEEVVEDLLGGEVMLALDRERHYNGPGLTAKAESWPVHFSLAMVTICGTLLIKPSGMVAAWTMSMASLLMTPSLSRA